ncbi:MAG: hypothetical protein R3B06_09760 [Kofleriaceae bacterium]
MRSHLVLGALLATAAGCTADLNGRAEPPALTVTSPARGTIREGMSTVTVTGTVAPGSSGAAVTGVTVNGVVADLALDGSWSATVPVFPGSNMIETHATGADGGQADDVRGVLTGTFRPAAASVENAIAAQLSAQTFTVLGDTAGRLVASTDLGAFVAPYNPVIAKGLTNGHEDCLYGKVSVLPGLDVATADIGLVPGDAGLALDVTLHQLDIPLHARYAAACIDADTDIRILASAAHIQGLVTVTVADGRYQVKLESPTVTFTGFDVRASGLPGAVISLLNLEDEIGRVMANSIEKFIGPMVEQTVAGIVIGPQSVDVLGQTVTAEVAAAGIAFDSAGAEMVLDSSIAVAGGDAGFVFTDDQAPPQRGAAGVQLALADDTVNQLLTGFWSAGGLDLTLAQQVGSYDAISIEALLPPTVSPGADGALRIVMPDMILHLRQGEQELTTMALAATMELKVAPRPGYPNIASLTVAPPVLHADFISDVTGLPAAGLETLMPMMVEQMMGDFTSLLAAVPLPALPGGLRASSLNLGTAGSYVVFNAALE